MPKKTFSISEYIKPDDVSNLDHSADGEKIVQLPICEVAENDLNFYDTTDVGELANSIALNGLLEPIIVFPHSEDGGKKYRIISGHRRFKAFSTLAEDDPEKYETISAIVREPPKNEIVEELLLIEGNRATRVLSSADTLKQAERYKALLVELKEQGVEIPGRLRDVVAEAMQISASRLARLEVIRKGLIPEYREDWEAGRLSESAAYELARLIPAHQRQLHGNVKITDYSTSCIPALDEKLNMYFGPGLKCDRNRDSKTQTPGYCDHGAEMWEVSRKKYIYNMCRGCCADCYDRMTCKSVCPRVAPDVQREKQERQAAAAKQKTLRESRQAEKDNYIDTFWTREQAAREAAGLTPEEAYTSLTEICKMRGVMTVDCADDLIEQENGCAISPENDDSFWRDDDTPFDMESVRIYADLYKCSVDYLMGRSDKIRCETGGEGVAPSASDGQRWRSFVTEPPEEEQCFIFFRYSFNAAEHKLYSLGFWHDGKLCDRFDDRLIPWGLEYPIEKSMWIPCDDPEKANE